GARTLAIVNVVGSTIAKLADHTLYTWAGPEIAVATTKGYTTQLSVLYLFAVYAAHTMELLP
ncbi:MAG: SIS domain-containing protein, partial [Oscillospiraceae bacterium]|nr:SIS domain-containing protein [Oscillospiraceae bacterium]